jgi:hypothetical protein
LHEFRRFDEALTAYQEDLAICRETDDRHGEGTALNKPRNGQGRKAGLTLTAKRAPADPVTGGAVDTDMDHLLWVSLWPRNDQAVPDDDEPWTCRVCQTTTF